jgi:hypothetical protein
MRAERQRKLLPDSLSYFVLEGPGCSNLGLESSYPAEVFNGFPQSLYATAKTVPQIMIMTTSFLIFSHYHPLIQHNFV